MYSLKIETPKGTNRVLMADIIKIEKLEHDGFNRTDRGDYRIDRRDTTRLSYLIGAKCEQLERLLAGHMDQNVTVECEGYAFDTPDNIQDL